MTSIWFPNNKYPPNTKNYLPCFVLGGGLVLGGRDYPNQQLNWGHRIDEMGQGMVLRQLEARFITTGAVFGDLQNRDSLW